MIDRIIRLILVLHAHIREFLQPKMERTFVMVKNDGVHRRLVGEVIRRLERKGLYLVQAKVVLPTYEILREHYAEHVNKPFFKKMAEGMVKSEVVPMVWEGINAVKVARTIIGSTNPMDAANGTIRGDYGLAVGKNIVHGADSVESAKREMKIWFGEDIPEIVHFDEEVIYE